MKTPCLFFLAWLITSLMPCTWCLELSDWIVETTFSGVSYRSLGAYNKNAQNSDCIYVTRGFRRYLCYHISTNSLEILAINQDWIYGSVHQSTALFTASETGSNDTLYFMNANDREIVKFNTSGNTTSILSGSMSSLLNTNPCMIRHPTDTRYLFIIGQDITSTSDVNRFIIYNIINETWIVVNRNSSSLHYFHSYPSCIVMNIDSINYFYVLIGKSVYVERIDLDAVISDLDEINNNGEYNGSDSIFDEGLGTEINLNTQWEIMDGQLTTNDTNGIDYSRMYASPVVRYDKWIILLGGWYSSSLGSNGTVYYNVETNDVGYVGTIPRAMGDFLAMYVVYFCYVWTLGNCTCYAINF